LWPSPRRCGKMGCLSKRNDFTNIYIYNGDIHKTDWIRLTKMGMLNQQKMIIDQQTWDAYTLWAGETLKTSQISTLKTQDVSMKKNDQIRFLCENWDSQPRFSTSNLLATQVTADSDLRPGAGAPLPSEPGIEWPKSCQQASVSRV
jgi:hypothetical protein